MSDKKEKIYINAVTLKAGKFEGQIMFSGKADEFIKQIQEHTNERGWFNFIINAKKGGADDKGQTHYITVMQQKT